MLGRGRGLAVVGKNGRIGRRSGDAETSRGGLRLRNQAEYFALARRPPLRNLRRSSANFRRRRSGDEAGRRIPFERSGRAGADGICRRKRSQNDWTRTYFRDLPGASSLGGGAGRKNIQAEIWASRLESSGKKPAHRASGNHRAKSWLLRGPGIPAFQQSRNHARESERSPQ